MNSPLVNYTKISPNSSARTSPVRKITIHHMAGDLTVEQCGEGFASPARKASSTYGIGSDGRIGQYVDESRRPWTSSSTDNDNQAITIEVANSGGAPDWTISEAALNSLIALCADICRRNGIERLYYTGDATGNLTRHNMFAQTACPGPYLQGLFPYIAEEVNKRLAPADEPSSWAKDAWAWAKEAGITDGTNPQGACTREQVVTMLHRYHLGRK